MFYNYFHINFGNGFSFYVRKSIESLWGKEEICNHYNFFQKNNNDYRQFSAYLMSHCDYDLIDWDECVGRDITTIELWKKEYVR